jgi:hypothetical protein
MPKLASNDLVRHRAWLTDWRTPADMASYVASVNCEMGSRAFLAQPGTEFLREAWLAAEFGRHRQSEAVRLVAPEAQWPDFEAQAGGKIDRVECAEADVPGRKRGNEYKKLEIQLEMGGSAVENDPVDNWLERAALIPAALDLIVVNKSAKNYAERVDLLIYLNIGEYGLRQAETEIVIARAIGQATSSFARVWVLWKDRLYGASQP